jgi:hypothetical protein
MALNLANVVSTDTFSTWLNRTNQIIERSSNSTPKFLDFEGATHASLAAQEGRTYFDNTHKSLTVFSEGGLEMELGQNEYIRVYNNSGVQINLGQPLFLSGSTGGVPNAQLANASNASKYNISGLAASSIGNSSYGWAAVSGTLRGLDTSSLTQGERFFVSASANGQLVTTPPTYPNYPMCVGLCVVSDSANGIVVIEQQNHSVPSFRVINNAHIGGNLDVDGNLNVLGGETVTTLTNLSIDDSFVYLNGGDTLTANSTAVTGLNDFTFKGHYNGGNTVTFYVKIDNTNPGNPDTFSWSLDNFSTTEAANVAITASQQSLRWGISALFVANTGHTAGDIWTGGAAPLNVDTGWASNRNTGQAAGGYTHVGVFFDVTDERFKFFQSYDPEVQGNINTAHTSFELGTVQANTFIGDGSQLTNAGSTVATDSANHDLFVPFTGVSSGTMTSANVNSNFTFNPSTGTLSATAFSGDGSNLTNAGSSVATDGGANRELFVPFTGISSGTMTSANVDAQFTFNPGTETLSANSTATVFNVVNDGVTAYQFNGGGTSTNNNPTLLLSRGKVYKFNVNASGHPFYIKTINSTGTGNAYNDGVTNNGAEVGLVTFQVPNHAPAVLHYNCSAHAAMNGRIIIDSGFNYDESANAMFVDSIKTRTLLDSSNRQLTIRDEANNIVWGG